MKIIKIISCALLLSSSFIGYGQKKIVEDTLTVQGLCGQCKARIEEAAFGKGVKFAEWTNATSQLALAYRSDKTSLEEIEGRIVKAGHSTSSNNAIREDYNALPECCKYEQGHKH